MFLAAYLGLLALFFTTAHSLEHRERLRPRRPYSDLRPYIDKRGLPDYSTAYSPQAYPQFASGGHGYYIPQPQQSHPSPHNSLSSLISGYSLNFSPSQSKTGPVTFDNSEPGVASPYYVTAMQDTGKYQNQALQILLGALQSSQKSQHPQTYNQGHQALIIPSPLVYSMPVFSSSYDSSQSQESYKLPSYPSQKYSPVSSSGSAYVADQSPSKYSSKATYSVPYPSSTYSNSIVSYASNEQDSGDGAQEPSTAQLKALIQAYSSPAKDSQPQYYSRYSSDKNPDNYKYDTISYSSINGKY